jgi:hypothetical protein
MNEAELGFELKNALARIEALEAALRDIAALEAAGGHIRNWMTMREIARAALPPEQDKAEDTSVEDTIEAIKDKHK